MLLNTEGKEVETFWCQSPSITVDIETLGNCPGPTLGSCVGTRGSLPPRLLAATARLNAWIFTRHARLRAATRRATRPLQFLRVTRTVLLSSFAPSRE
eukprot:1369481-Amphidinium_carterae.1